MNLCYCSNMNLNIFPENNAFKFSARIDCDKTIFNDSQQIVCLKQIFMDGSVLKECDEGDVLAIKSNICMNSIISTSENSLLCVFTLKKQKHPHQIIDLTFQNPICFSTLTNCLLNADFEIWNLDKNKQIDIDASFPTYIIIQIQSKMTFEENMNKKILYIDSKDFNSKQCFQNNNNSNFTIQLPHNLDFKNDATACLKSIFIPNKIKYNHDYKIDVLYQNGKEKIIIIDQQFEDAFKFISYLNNIFTGDGIIFQLKEEKVTVLKSIKSMIEKIKLSSNLASTLGHSELLLFPKNGSLKNVAKEKINVNFNRISFLIVDINIIEKTIFGENQVGILKILPIKANDGVLSSYYFSENEKKKLKIRNFSQITIKILTDDLEIVEFSAKDVGTKLMLEIDE